MKIGDIYKHKESGDIIQIDSFASHINDHNPFKTIIVYAHIMKSMGMYGSSPSFNGYGSQEEIEAIYELAVSQEELKNFESFEDIVEYINNKGV